MLFSGKYIILFIITLIFCGYVSKAQAPEIQWQRAIGGSEGDQAISIRQTSDGGFIAAGNTSSIDGDVFGNHGVTTADIWIVKYDLSGNIQWQKLYGGTATEVANSIELTTDGGYIVAGFAISDDGDVTGNDGGLDLWVVKMDSAGTMEWQKTYGGHGGEYGECIRQTTDGGYIIASTTTSSDGDVTGFHGQYDFWIIKISAAGDLIWQKALGGSDDDQAKSVIEMADGSFMATGWTSSGDGDVTDMKGCYDGWLVKLSSTGELLWQQTFGGSICDNGLSIAKTSDGGFIVAGSTSSPTQGYHGYQDFWLIKFTATGYEQWQRAYGGMGLDEANSVQQTIDGGYILAGFTYSSDGDVVVNHGTGDGWIVKTNSQGIMQWQKPVGGTDPEELFCIEQSTDGGFIVAGMSQSDNGDLNVNKGYYDYWVLKLFQDPFLSLTGQPLKNAGVYPNPADKSFQIVLPDNEMLENLILTDLTGKIVFEQKGDSKVVNIENLAPGIYIVRAISGNSIYQSKVMKK